MNGFSYGLLVDHRHDGPVAGGTPHPHAARTGALADGMRRIGVSLREAGARTGWAAIVADWRRRFGH